MNITCPINKLGYGVAGYNIAGSLAKKVPISLFPINKYNMEINSETYREEIQEAVKRTDTEGYDKKAPSLRIYHQFDLAHHVGKGAHIGFPIFELDTFSKVELSHLNNQDYIFVCSNWAKRIIEQNSRTPTYVVPLGVDTSIFHPVKKHHTTTRFFNMGKWEVRKGHDILVDAFCNAFTEKDDVELYLCCNNPFYSEQENKEWEKIYTTCKLASKIRIVLPRENHYEVAAFMNEMDCGVFLSRGEGWNLEALEAMACNKPVIVTEYSAHVDFCTPYLIYTEEVEPAFDGKWFFGQGNWAKIGPKQIEQAVYYMRRVHENKQSGHEYNVVDTAKKFTWKHTAAKILDTINEIT